MQRLFLIVAIVLFLFPGADSYAAGLYVPGEILVAFKPEVPASMRRSVIEARGAGIAGPNGDYGFTRVRVPAGTVLAGVGALRDDPAVLYAEPNYIITAYGIPSDPLFGLQWHFSMIDVENAWDVSTGEGVTVAVVDTGIEPNGNDGFGDRLLDGYNAFWNVRGFDTDVNNHGTHVAGTIAQETNNAIGVAGVAYNASILPVKALTSFRSGVVAQGTVASVSAGIRWAVDNGADIINLSLGTDSPSWFLQQAAEYAYDHDVTVVAASGNTGGDVGYPAAYDSVIAVGAVNYLGLRAYYSSYGATLDVVAPGGDRSRDDNNDGYPDGVFQETFDRELTFGTGGFDWRYEWDYKPFNGTSMACPHVAGVAALVKSLHPEWGPDEIREAIVATARDLGVEGKDDVYGYGLVDAYGAVTY